MTRAPTIESAGAARAADEPLRVACVTAWPHGEEQMFTPAGLRPGSARLSELREAATHGPVWLDLQLDTDVQRWMRPWDELDVRTDWSSLAPIASAIGLGLPDGGREQGRLVLDRLPVINEYGVLRWLSERAFPKHDPPLVMPLVGFIPGDDLEPLDGTRTAGLEYVLMRVNLAVVGDCVVTIRLTDRLCTGSRRGEPGHRLRAADFYAPPNLSLFGRFIGSAGRPSATDLADALAGYLAATCSTALESARDRLRDVERRLAAAAFDEGECPVIKECHDELLLIRPTLERVDEELSRLMQRLSDPHNGHPALARARLRYDDAIRQLHSVEGEMRWVSDAATNQLATRRFEAQRKAESRYEQRQKSLEKVVAGLGTALVIAALVPSLFGEDAKLPRPGRLADFLGMVLIMVGAAVVVFSILFGVLSAFSAEGDPTSQDGARRWTPISVAVYLTATAMITTGVALLLFG